MRVRRGFVSNSSTTSFCIYGVGTNEDVWGKEGVSDLEVHGFNDYADHSYAVGISWHQIKDDETGAQFKERVEALVKLVVPDANEFSTLSDAYYDG